MVIINEYISIACGDGSIKFYDFSLRLEAWFEDIAAGPVTSLSFALQASPYVHNEVVRGSKMRFWAPDFIVATSDVL